MKAHRWCNRRFLHQSIAMCGVAMHAAHIAHTAHTPTRKRAAPVHVAMACTAGCCALTLDPDAQHSSCFQSSRMLRWAVSLACVALCWTAATAAPKAPVWPDAYEVQYTVELPYVESLQPVPLKYPVKVWYDGARELLRTNFYDGLDETFLTEDATYDIFPRITTRTCLVFNHSTGPTATGEEGGIVPPLPDIDEQWVYGGVDQLKGKPPAHIWQLSYRVEEKVSTYTFYVSQATGAPLRLHMVGVNLFTGSHYDQYEVDFTYFQPRSNDNAFKPPELCKAAAEAAANHPHTQPGPGLSRTAVLQTALSLLPSSLVPKGLPTGQVTAQHLQQGRGMMQSMQDLLSSVVTRVMGTQVTEDGSEATVLANLQYIQEHNQARDKAARAALQLPRKAGGSNVAVSAEAPVAPSDLYHMDVNKFVSWSEDRFQGTMLGRLPGQAYKNRRGSAHLGVYERQLPDDALPAEVDWRGTGADGPVKDQASCGSCWTFATTGAMTGAWFKATGQSLSFSEQQIVDCSWNYDVNGCWGGNTEPALDYIKEAGGIALEANYPYIGQNGYCKDHKVAKAAAFKGYKSIPEGDEKALMEAVALHGPLSIAFDAGDRSFRYYSEGVYYRKDCGTTVDDLNHAVTLVGYGTTWNGTDYWLLRNSWSVAWGADGYFKITRKGNDCGITTDAVLAVVDPEAVERATGGATY